MTNAILVSGLINVETTLRVESFPLTYEPVRFPFFGVNSTTCGVGYNIAKALTKLGSQNLFLSIIGDDPMGKMVLSSLEEDGLSAEFIEVSLPATAQSVIIYDRDGKRQIHTDLKDIQERNYSLKNFQKALQVCSTTVLCNINYNRPFLKIAKKANKLIATDVHTLDDIEDTYNQDFMAAADILFMSDELLPCPPQEFSRQIQKRFHTPIIVIGMGAKGALLAVKADDYIGCFGAVSTRQVVNTIGAGDALFSAFIHTYSQTKDPYLALRKATLFASYKVGSTGAAEGYLSGRQLDDLYEERKAAF